MSGSSCKYVFAFFAAVAMTFCSASAVQAQGFRIGNVMQAGGGQGFRLGFPRFGMHFGGGQGASFGGPNVGMRFGNGQGARFGAGNYGMQFGGGQGSQIGYIGTTPNVAPGTYYYDDVRRLGGAQPMYAAPSYASPGNAQPNMASPEYASPSATYVQEPLDVSQSASVTSPSTPVLSSDIRLSFPPDATETFNYRLNDTPFTIEPGASIVMASGQTWRLEFSAGDGLGDREATLSTTGNYVLTKTDDEGWVLMQDKTLATPESQNVGLPANEDAPAADNSAQQQSVLINEPKSIETPKAELDQPAPSEPPAADGGK